MIDIIIILEGIY